MKVTKLAIPDVLLIEPKVFEDSRGFFMETYNAERYAEHGMTHSFVQDNHSKSSKGTLRGLHYQLGKPQGKLVHAVQGEVFDVAVDVRLGSPYFGRWVGAILSAKNRKQIYIPEGFAHGFCVLSEEAEFLYKCTDFYSPSDERGVLWNDPDVGIEWPIDEPLLSDKDAISKTLAEMKNELPVYKEH